MFSRRPSGNPQAGQLCHLRPGPLHPLTRRATPQPGSQHLEVERRLLSRPPPITTLVGLSRAGYSMSNLPRLHQYSSNSSCTTGDRDSCLYKPQEPEATPRKTRPLPSQCFEKIPPLPCLCFQDPPWASVMVWKPPKKNSPFAWAVFSRRPLGLSHGVETPKKTIHLCPGCVFKTPFGA